MKRIIHIITALGLIMLLAVGVTASDSDDRMYSERLYDGADILSAAEEAELLERLDSVSEEYSFDIVVVTVDSIGYRNAELFADDFFDDGNYRSDGALLLIGLEGNDIAISTSGSGMSIISNSRIDEFWDELVEYFSKGNYADGFGFFIDRCEYRLYGERYGYPFDFGGAILVSLVVCIVAAIIVTSHHKRKLKSVSANNFATGYMRAGSMNITTANEIYLYSNVVKTRKHNSNNGSGGSRMSSSGRIHGGRSGKF